LSLPTAPATTQTSTLSLHDALPILHRSARRAMEVSRAGGDRSLAAARTVRTDGRSRVRNIRALDSAAGGALPREVSKGARRFRRSEEHTSELQSPYDLVCRLLLEKK